MRLLLAAVFTCLACGIFLRQRHAANCKDHRPAIGRAAVALAILCLLVAAWLVLSDPGSDP